MNEIKAGDRVIWRDSFRVGEAVVRRTTPAYCYFDRDLRESRIEKGDVLPYSDTAWSMIQAAYDRRKAAQDDYTFARRECYAVWQEFTTLEAQAADAKAEQ